MPRFRVLSILFTLLGPTSIVLSAQQSQPPKPQTARQAIIEMITGGEQAAFKHLTVEVQQSMKKPGFKPIASPAAAFLSGLRGTPTSGMETFDTGSVLLSFTEEKVHEKLEVHVENDDLTADEDRLVLSLHTFRDGQEIDTPLEFISQIAVGMKRQEDIWRLNDITVSAKIPIGNPRQMEQLGAASGGQGGMLVGRAAGISAGGHAERPKLDTENTVRMLAFAEGMYAGAHPETGFTCSLADLVNQTKAMSGMGIDPSVGAGSLNGYRFAISGCQGTPAGSFQLTAEPMTAAAGAKAFCTDATHNIRVSEDGRSSTCITAGKPEQLGRVVRLEAK